MFREMRRKTKELSKEETIEILQNASYGSVAILGDNGYPYCFPINFAFANNQIIFHGAKEGYKNDLIKNECKCSFNAVSEETLLPKEFDTLYKSVIAFGTVKSLEDTEEKKTAAMLLIQKYSNNFKEDGAKYIDRAIDGTAVYVIDVEHITGKEGK